MCVCLALLIVTVPWFPSLLVAPAITSNSYHELLSMCKIVDEETSTCRRQDLEIIFTSVTFQDKYNAGADNAGNVAR